MAHPFSLSGELALVTRYVDEDLSVYAGQPALQPELSLSHGSSGCYATLWISAGIADGAGDEADILIGCERTLAGAVAIDAAVGRYFFRDGAWSVVSLGASVGDFGLRADAYVPTYDAPAGLRFVGSYTRNWQGHSLVASLTYDTGLHNDAEPIGVAAVRGDVALFSRGGLFVVAQLPVLREREDTRRSQVSGGIAIRF